MVSLAFRISDYVSSEPFHPARAVRQLGIKPRDFLRVAAVMHFPALGAFAVSLRAEVLAIFRRDMRSLQEANAHALARGIDPSGVDKYFHCKANCEAAQLGYLAEAILLSDAKEAFDLTVDNWFLGGHHTEKDSTEDQLANRQGRASASVYQSAPCTELCAIYRPHWLPEHLW